MEAWQGDGEEGTHHSWNPSTQTGSLPSPLGTWGRRYGGTSPRAAGTESHRMCTWGGAGRAANGSHCCCEVSLSGTCGREESLSIWSREEQSASLYATPSFLCSWSPFAPLGQGLQSYPQIYPQQYTHRDHRWGQTSPNPTPRSSFFHAVLRSAAFLSPRQV